MVPDINKKLNLSSINTVASVSKKEAEYIYRFLTKCPPKKTIETGFSIGYSTAHIISATKRPHYVIDPFQEEINNRGIKNIKKLGLGKYLHFYNDYSHSVLPKLLEKNKKFDFAFVDGGHKFDEVFIDFYYLDLLLEKNGYILFHDNWMPSTQLTANWIRTNKKNYEEVITNLENLVMLKK